jgi:hypothetical protein
MDLLTPELLLNFENPQILFIKSVNKIRFLINFQ